MADFVHDKALKQTPNEIVRQWQSHCRGSSAPLLQNIHY